MAADLRGTLRRPWLLYVAIGLGASVAYFLLPDVQDLLYLLIGFSAAWAIIAGRRIHGPTHRGWPILAAGIVFYCLGDVVYTILVATTGEEPFPSLADLPYLLGQLLVVIGVGRLAAPIERGFYRPALIDAALVATAGAFISWPLVLDPLTSGQADLFGGAVALSYPLIDLVLVGVLARHALQPGRKPISVLFLIGGAAAWLVADLAYVNLSVAEDGRRMARGLRARRGSRPPPVHGEGHAVRRSARSHDLQRSTRAHRAHRRDPGPGVRVAWSHGARR
jgi:hypothetical protein